MAHTYLSSDRLLWGKISLEYGQKRRVFAAYGSSFELLRHWSTVEDRLNSFLLSCFGIMLSMKIQRS